MRVTRAERILEVAQSLEEIQTADQSAAALRDLAVAALARAVGVEQAMFFGVGQLTSGTLDVASVRSVGLRDPEAFHRTHRTNLRAFPGLLRDPSSARRGRSDVFFGMQQLVDREAFEQSAYFALAWQPEAIGDALWLFTADQDVCTGWIGALRPASKGPFSRRFCGALAPLVAPLTRILSAAHQLEQASVPAAPAHLVLTQRGQLECGSAGAERWLALPGLQRGLLEEVHEMNRQGAQHRAFALECAEASVVALSTPSDDRRYLVHLSALAPLAASPFAPLSDSGVAVATLAAQGMSATAIAKTRGVSGHTVKAQLKTVYRRLGISSRAELATLFAAHQPLARTDERSAA